MKVKVCSRARARDRGRLFRDGLLGLIPARNHPERDFEDVGELDGVLKADVTGLLPNGDGLPFDTDGISNILLRHTAPDTL